MSHPPTTLDELAEQRDAELVRLIMTARTDVQATDRYLSNGNLVAARHMLVAIDAELEIMRGLLP